MKSVILFICVLLIFCTSASAQDPGRVTAGASYVHKTGGGASNGIELSGEYRLNKYVRAVAEFTPYWGGTTVATVKTSFNEQDYMFGGRFNIPYAFRNPKLIPYGQLLYGWSRQATKVKTINGPDITDDSATDWAWDFGGGVEYLMRSRYKLRGGVSLWRTHFADLSQTNAKFHFGLVYCLGQRACGGAAK
jgi:hypothetical protein